MSSGVMANQGRGSQTLCSARWTVPGFRDTLVLLRAFLTPALGKKLPANNWQSNSLNINFQNSRRCAVLRQYKFLLVPFAIHFRALRVQSRWAEKASMFTLAALRSTISGNSSHPFLAAGLGREQQVRYLKRAASICVRPSWEL